MEAIPEMTRDNNVTYKRCFLCRELVDVNYGVRVSNEFICGTCACTYSPSELKERIKKKLFKENGKEGILNPEVLTLD
jgi:hypothetical protein